MALHSLGRIEESKGCFREAKAACNEPLYTGESQLFEFLAEAVELLGMEHKAGER